MHNYCDFAENSGKGRSLILKCIWCLLAFDSYEEKYVRKAGEDAMIRKYLVKYIIFLLLFLLFNKQFNGKSEDKCDSSGV